MDTSEYLTEVPVRRHLSAPGIRWDLGGDMCRSYHFNDDTTKDSPTTGGVQEMRNWANTRAGSFWIRNGIAHWQTIVIAGSNGGTNARFEMKLYNLHENVHVGTEDIWWFAKNTLDKYQRKFDDGKWRAGGWGDSRCWSYYSRTWGNYYRKVYWVINRTGSRVPGT